MFGNKNGYTSVESLWIVPVMLMIMLGLVIIIALVFQYINGILDVHYSYLNGSVIKTVEVTYKDGRLTYSYEPPFIETKVLQESIELIIYYIEMYGDALEGIGYEK